MLFAEFIPIMLSVNSIPGSQLILIEFKGKLEDKLLDRSDSVRGDTS